MNNANKKKQDEIKNRLEEIVRREYTGHYPLAARQCLHWARQGLYPVLIVFLPDLERDLREEGKVVAAERVSAIIQEVKGSL